MSGSDEWVFAIEEIKAALNEAIAKVPMTDGLERDRLLGPFYEMIVKLDADAASRFAELSKSASGPIEEPVDGPDETDSGSSLRARRRVGR